MKVESMENNCDCIDIEVGSFDNQVEITHPNLSHPIMVDKCIAEEIKDLLDKGIKTIGSCCGHNKTTPSIIVAPESVKQMEDLGYIHGFNPNIPIGYGSDLLFFPKSVLHKGYELLEWRCVPKPLFILTAKEVEWEEQILGAALLKYHELYTANKQTCTANDWKEAIDYCHKQLTRIKQWRNENQ